MLPGDQLFQSSGWIIHQAGLRQLVRAGGFALLHTGDFEKVRSMLYTFIRFQDLNGKIFHELATSGVVHFDASDATSLAHACAEADIVVNCVGPYTDCGAENRWSLLVHPPAGRAPSTHWSLC